jgi:hypothetical protein
MGEGFNAYLNSLRETRQVEAEMQAQRQARMTQIGIGIAEALQKVAEKREAQRAEQAKERQKEGLYQMKARDAGLFKEEPVDVPAIPDLQKKREAILSRRAQVEQEIAGRTNVQPGMSINVEDRQAELERNKAALARVDDQIRLLSASPDYADQVKAAQWRDWLKKNPIGSETYFRAMSWEQPKVERPSDVRAEQAGRRADERLNLSRSTSASAKKKSYIDSISKMRQDLDMALITDEQKVERARLFKTAIDALGRASDLAEIDRIYSDLESQISALDLRSKEEQAKKETRRERREREKKEREARNSGINNTQLNGQSVNTEEDLVRQYGGI